MPHHITVNRLQSILFRPHCEILAALYKRNLIRVSSNPKSVSVRHASILIQLLVKRRERPRAFAKLQKAKTFRVGKGKSFNYVATEQPPRAWTSGEIQKMEEEWRSKQVLNGDCIVREDRHDYSTLPYDLPPNSKPFTPKFRK